MRHIRKRAEPPAFRDWKRDNSQVAGGPKFGALDPVTKEALRDQMLAEQGYLCAYTMWPLDSRARLHIEHLKPQSRYPDRALDYDNMLLCVTGGRDGIFGFGANKKANSDIDDDTFVSPLQLGCEGRFRFHFDGDVTASDPGDRAALGAIATLALDHDELKAARRRAIRVQLVGEGGRKPLSPTQARRLADGIAGTGDGDKLPPFCVALRQVALRIAAQREQRGKRLAARQDR